MARGDLAKSLKFYRVDSWTGEVQATWTIPALPPGASQAVPSPDLMTIYFLRKNDTVPCGTTNCTYIMSARDLRSGRDREVFRTGEAIQWRISISPDGHEMAVIASGSPDNRILIAPTTGGAPREIYRGDIHFFCTAWTRDGRHVLAFPLGGGEVWSIPAAGGAPARSPIRLRVSEAAAVSPDGTQVAFVANSHTAEIWVMTGLFKDSVKGK
jgi:hypothetical protein